MTDFTAYLRLGVDSRDAVSAQKNLDKMSASAGNADKSFSLLGGASRVLGAALGAVGAGKIAGDIISITRETGIMTASLRTATGSAESATVAFDAITKLASQLPESVDSVATAFTKLVNYGLNPSEAAIKSYSNTAAALGKDLSQMVEAVADAATGEFERLKEFGIKSKVQGDRVSFTFRGVTETVKNSAAEIEGYLQDIGNNEFAGSAAEQMKELDGVISNLGDTYDGLLRTISKKGAGDLIGSSVRTATSALQELNDFVESDQAAGYLDAIAIKFSLIKDIAVSGFGIIIDAVHGLYGAWYMATNEFYGFFGSSTDSIMSQIADGFLNLPENIRAFIQLATVEIAVLVDKAMIYGEQIAFAMNPANWFSDMPDISGALAAVDSARMTSIETILQERETAIKAFDDQINKANELRAKYDENNSAVLAGGDALAQFQIKATESVEAVSQSEEMRAASIAKTIAELEKQNALFDNQSKYAEILYEIETGLLKVTDAEKARYLAAAQTNDQLVANKNLADSIDAFAKKSEEDKAALDELISSVDEFGGAWSRTGSIVADSLGTIGDAMNDYSSRMAAIAAKEEELSKARMKFMGDPKELKKIGDAEKKLATERTKANLSSFSQISGAASKMFDEQSKARKTLHGLEMAFSAIEMAMTIQESILDAKKAVLNQGKGDPYTAWARMAAMAAVVAAIGYGVSGASGGGGTSAQAVQEAQGTGTVLGSNDKSESIANAMEMYNDIGLEQLGELRMIREGLTGLTGGINKLSVGVMTSGLTEQKYINFADTHLGVPMASGQFDLYGSRKVDAERRAALAPLQSQIVDIFSYIGDTTSAAIDMLGLTTTESLNSFYLQIGKVSFKGLSGEEIQSELNAIFSQQADLITKHLVPAMEQYQQMGEGLFDTLTRIAAEMATFNYYTDALGLDFNMTGLAAIAAQQAIAEFSGGMDKLTENLQSYYEEFFTEEERAANQMKLLAAEMKNLGYDTVPTSREAFRALVEGLVNDTGLMTEESQKTFAGLVALSEVFADLVPATEAAANATRSAADIAQERASLEERLWQLTATTADVREKELAALDGTNKSILDQIFALQDLQAAEKAAADARLAVTNQLASLEKQYFDLTATEAEKRNALMQSLLSDEARAIQQNINDWNDAKKAQGEKLSLEKQYFDLTATEQQKRTALLESLLSDEARTIQENIYAWNDAQKASAEAAQAIEDAANAMEQLKSAASSAFDILKNSVDAERARIESIVAGASSAKNALDSAISNEKSLLDAAHSDRINQLTAQANAEKEANAAIAKARIDSLNDEAGAIRDRIGGLQSLFDELSGAAADMALGGSLISRRRAAEFELDTALRNAQAGRGVPTDGRISSALSTLRENPSDLYANAQEMAFANAVTQNKISELAGLTGKQLTSEEKSLAAIERQIATAEKTAAVTATSFDALIEQANAQYAADIAALEAMQSNAQLQYDALTGIDTRTLSVEEALTKFNESLLAADFEDAQQQYARLDGILEQGKLQLDTLLDIDSGVLSLRDAIDRFAAAVASADQQKVNDQLIAEMKRTADEMKVMREDQRRYAFAQIKELQDINLYTRETAINSEPVA